MNIKKPLWALFLSSVLLLTACSSDKVDSKDDVVQVEDPVEQEVHDDEVITDVNNTLTPEELDELENLTYQIYLDDHMQRFDEFAVALSDYFDGLNEETEWDEMAGQLVNSVQGITLEVIEYKHIPEIYEELHTEYLAGMADYRLAVEDLMDAVLAQELEKLMALSSHMESGAKRVATAAEELKGFDTRCKVEIDEDADC